MMLWKYKVVELSEDAKASEKHLSSLWQTQLELVAVRRTEKCLCAFLKVEAAEVRANIRL